MRTLTAIQTTLLAAALVQVAVGGRVLGSGSLRSPMSKSSLSVQSQPASTAITRLVTTGHHIPQEKSPTQSPMIAIPTTVTTTTTTSLPRKSTGSSSSSLSDESCISEATEESSIPVQSKCANVVGTDEEGILNKFGRQKLDKKGPDDIYILSGLNGELSSFIEAIEGFNLAYVRMGSKCAHWHTNMRVYGPNDLEYIPVIIETFIGEEWKKASHCIEWTGKSAVLVVIGNIFGSGPHSKGMVYFLMALREKARVAGGDVVIILGDHDIDVFTPHGTTPSRIALAQFEPSKTQRARYFELEYKIKYPTKENPFSPAKATLLRKDSKGKGKAKETLSNPITDEERIEHGKLLTSLNELRRKWLLKHFKVNPLIVAQIGPYLFAHAGPIRFGNAGPGVQNLNDVARHQFRMLVDPTTTGSEQNTIGEFFNQHIKHEQYSSKATADDLVIKAHKDIKAQAVALSKSLLQIPSKHAKTAVCGKVDDVLEVNKARRIFVGHPETDSHMVGTLCGGRVVYTNTGSGYFPLEDQKRAFIRNLAIVQIKFDEPEKEGIRRSATIWAGEQEPWELKPTDPTDGQVEKRGIPKFINGAWRSPRQLPYLSKDRKVKSTASSTGKMWKL